MRVNRVIGGFFDEKGELMIGAIIGDIVGSRFEFIDDMNRGKDFLFFAKDGLATDDSFMTLAIAQALFLCKGDYSKLGDYAVSCTFSA